MANTAPQTNEPGAFDSDGLPIHGLIIPGQATMTGVFGSVLVTDPTSSDQGTVPHIPMAAIAKYNEQSLISGATWASQAATLAGVPGRTLYLTMLLFETDIWTAAANVFFTVSGIAAFSGTVCTPVTTSGLFLTRTYTPPIASTGVNTAIVVTSTAIGTTGGFIRWAIAGFAL